MKKIILVALATTIIIGCLTTTTTATTTLSTIDYEKYAYIDIPSTTEVNLTYIWGEFNETALLIEKVGVTSGNTRFLVTSQPVQAKWWMKNNIKTFIYQDDEKNLYTININYTTLNIPQSPSEIALYELVDEYQNLNTTYQQLNNNYTTLCNDYTATWSQLNDTITNLNITLCNLDNLTTHYNKLCLNHTNITRELNETTNNYEQLKNNTMDLCQYEQFVTDYESYTDGFRFQGDWYKTKWTWNAEIQNLKDELGTANVLTWAVGIGLFICFFVVLYIIKKQNITITPVEEDLQYGYTEDAKKVDTFLTRTLNKLKPRNQPQPTTTMQAPATPDNGGNISEVQKSIDQMSNNINQLTSNIEKLVDQKLAKNGKAA